MLAILLISVANPAIAQQTTTAALIGTAIDRTTGELLTAVQVVVRPAGDTTAVAGSLTDRFGRFVIPSIGPGDYEVTFRRLGYATASMEAEVPVLAETAVDLGSVALEPSAVELAEVNVVAERPAVVYAADRDIYAADQIAGAAGGSATDLLEGIPDLEVDISGNVTLLGDQPAIYINGREAPMTGEALALFLEQFAAENVETIEVMPNPSARYDAEGAGGIVNIVLKEDVGLGISGNAFVNGGTRGQVSGGSRATWQRGPLTLNGGGSLRLSSDQSTSSQLRQNLLADPVTFLEQQGTSDRSRWSGNFDFRGGYELSSSTELSSDLRASRNVSEAARVTRYTETDDARSVLEEYDLITADDGSGSSIDFAIQLEHKFEADEQEGGPRGRGGPGRGRFDFDNRSDELQIELEFERGDDGEDSLVERRLLEDLGLLDYETELRLEEDRETESELALGFDFARGVTEKLDIEFGYEAEFGWTDESRLEEVRYDDPASSPVSTLDRAFRHRQDVHGGYLTLNRAFGDFGAQVGARAEFAMNLLDLPGVEDRFNRNDFDIFPSANLNYTLDSSKRVRLSYSMRVRRPGSRILNPINTSSDPLNLEIGNPDIEPQYTHSWMMNASWSGRVGFLRASPFFRRSVNEWEELRAVDAEGVATTTWENLGSTNSLGFSLAGSVRDIFGVSGRVNVNARHIDRNYAAVLDRETPSTFRWSVRTNLERAFSETLSAEGFVVYNPPVDLPQGRRSSTIMSRLGMRYRFLDRRASLNLNVTDPFNLYDSSIRRSDAGFVESGQERPSMRRLNLGLSYSFQSGQTSPGGGRGGRGDWRR